MLPPCPGNGERDVLACGHEPPVPEPSLAQRQLLEAQHRRAGRSPSARPPQAVPPPAADTGFTFEMFQRLCPAIEVSEPATSNPSANPDVSDPRTNKLDMGDTAAPAFSSSHVSPAVGSPPELLAQLDRIFAELDAENRRFRQQLARLAGGEKGANANGSAGALLPAPTVCRPVVLQRQPLPDDCCAEPLSPFESEPRRINSNSSEKNFNGQMERVAKKKEMKRKFTLLRDESGRNNKTIHEEIDRMLEADAKGGSGGCARAALAIDEALGYGDRSIQGDLSFDTFRDLLGTKLEELETCMSPADVAAILHIRKMFARGDIDNMLTEVMNVQVQDIALFRGSSSAKRCQRFFDTTVFVVIVLNAVFAAFETDYHNKWNGWDSIEYAFALFFVGELAYKLYMLGCLGFFAGEDWRWNCADCMFVFFGVVDAMLSMMQITESSLQLFMLMRLMRLMRITRIVRLLRFDFFKELLLMIQGISAGFRTLFWAIVLLLGVIFALGMLMRQTLGKWCLEEDPYCSNDHLLTNSRILFSTVPRSCFTVFRCLTEGCSSVDGTPLLIHIYDNGFFGAGMVILYMLVYLGVTFGLFNLIMAVFVENTMESAKLDERKRQRARQHDHIRVAQKLQKVVLQFTQGTGGSRSVKSLRASAGRRSGRCCLWGAPPENDDQVDADLDCTAEITRNMFADIVQDPSMEALLEDLEVSVSDPMNLFDTLDADDSGSIDVAELVTGIMRLRGVADKSDIIAPLLTARAMQRSLRSFEFRALRGLQELQAAVESQQL